MRRGHSPTHAAWRSSRTWGLLISRIEYSFRLESLKFTHGQSGTSNLPPCCLQPRAPQLFDGLVQVLDLVDEALARGLDVVRDQQVGLAAEVERGHSRPNASRFPSSPAPSFFSWNSKSLPKFEVPV